MSDTSVEISENLTLCEALDRVLNKGAVVVGDIAISVADIELIYISFQLMVSSVSNVQKAHTADKVTES